MITKRLFDILLSVFLLALLLPLLLMVSALVYITMGSPVFFIQNRSGKNGKTFKIIKFRTMMESNERTSITRTGAFLRRTSIDEIPELINIIKGEM